MFVDHYLDPIFLSPKQARSKTGPATNMKQVNGHMPEEEAIEDADSFLNALVDVDVDVEERQAQKASKRLVQVKSSGQAHAHSTPVAKGVGGHSVNGTHDLVNGVHADDVDDLMMNLDDNRGKTVKELSRLWQYLGGAEPEESSQ